MAQRKPIISARRTENLEALLQKLWTLRPMYKNRQAFTIAAGVAALIREIERTDLVLSVSATPNNYSPSTMEVEKTEEPSAPASEARANQVSDDVEWD